MSLSAPQVQALMIGSIHSDIEPRGTLVATSDEEGRFVVEGLLPSDGWVSAELDGYKKEWERIDVQEQPTELLIELQVAPSLRGRVVDLDGDPIPWARVNALGLAARVETGSAGARPMSSVALNLRWGMDAATAASWMKASGPSSRVLAVVNRWIDRSASSQARKSSS